MLAAYGRRMRASPGPTRRTLVVSIEALLDARDGKNLRGQGQAHRSPSENARELAVYMYSSLQAVSFREAVRVEAPTQGAGSESGYCILYGLQICQIVIRVHMLSHMSCARAPPRALRTAVAGCQSSNPLRTQQKGRVSLYIPGSARAHAQPCTPLAARGTHHMKHSNNTAL